MTEPDETMQQVGEALAAAQAGDRQRARDLLLAIWGGVGEHGDPLHRCAVAHHLADLQEDPRDELVWDVRALDAADSLTDERAAGAGVAGSVAGLYPSLHLNLGDVHLRLGDSEAARRHLDLGLAACEHLGADGYAAMVRRGLEGLRDRLAAR